MTKRRLMQVVCVAILLSVLSFIAGELHVVYDMKVRASNESLPVYLIEIDGQVFEYSE